MFFNVSPSSLSELVPPLVQNAPRYSLRKTRITYKLLLHIQASTTIHFFYLW